MPHFPASRRRHFSVSFFLYLVLGFHVGVWAVQLGSLTSGLRLDPAQLGLALSGAAAGGIVTLFLGGRVADHFGRRAVLATGFAATAVAFAWLAGARSFPEAAAAVVLYGLSISFVDLGANAVGSDHESAHGVESMTGLQSGFSLGAVVGALGSALLLTIGVDYRLVYVGLALVFLLVAALVVKLDLPARQAASPSDEGPSERAPVWRNTGVLFATAVVLVAFFGDGALEGFLAVFLRAALASGILLSGVGVAAFHLASFCGRILAAGLQQRLRPRRLIVAAGLLAATGIGVAVIAPSAWISIAATLLVGFAISPVVPSALSLAGRSAAPGQAGRSVAFTTAVGYSAFLVSPLVIGALASRTDLRIGLSVLVLTALLLAGLGSRWPESRVAERSSSGASPDHATGGR